MAATRRETNEPKKPRRRQATTPEARENQLISLAVDVAEQQMRQGTVSSQVLSHYLKLGSTRERIEQEKLMREVQLMEKKADTMDSAKKIEDLYEGAIRAMRSYSGTEEPVDGSE